MSSPDSLSNLKICCLGAGYVGGPTMAVIALKCPQIQITLCDLNQQRIQQWESDELPVYEPGLDEIVKKVRGKNLFFTTDSNAAIREADVVFLAINTPTKDYGVGAGAAANIEYILSAAQQVGELSTSPKIIVEKSTVPVKTADAIRTVLEKTSKHNIRFPILNNPEFLAEGTAVPDLLNPDRVLIGSDDTEEGRKALGVLYDIYAQWVPEERIITTNLWSSELSKLVANAFLAQRVSSINSISQLCDVTGANVGEIAKSIGADSRIGPKFLQASVGFGGSCFSKDVCNLVYLCRRFGLEEVADYWDMVLSMNVRQMRRFTRLIVRTMFDTVSHKRMAIFGFAFKKDTGDTRESPAIRVCQDLLEERAVLQIYDPKVKHEQIIRDLKMRPAVEGRVEDNVRLCGTLEESCVGAHAIVVLTEWDIFKKADYKRIFLSMKRPAFVFDGRNVLPHKELEKIGFIVYNIGRPM